MNMDWNTFLFMDEKSNECCLRHGINRVRFSSKLGKATMSKGFVCPRCEMSLMEYQNIVIRKNEKWIPIKEYMKHQVVASYGI